MFKFIILSLTIILTLTSCKKQITINENRISSNTSSITNLALKKHNNLRQLHFQNSNLTYSLKIEAYAQEYANLLASTGTFTHDPNNLKHKYGENLYRFSGSSSPNLNNIIEQWYNEKKYYDHQTQECEMGYTCGHYTQIIWKKSKLLGCASSQYKKGSYKHGYVTVCKYYPYGNIIGKPPY